MGHNQYKPRTLAVNERTLQAKELKRRSPAGQFGAVVAPSQEAVREAIAAHLCPFCGKGPYQSLAIHTCKVHGVDRLELRALAGMTTNEPVCSPEVSERRREIMKADPERIAHMNRLNRENPPDRSNWRWTEAGRRKLGSHLRKFNASEQGVASRRAAGQAGARARAEKLKAARLKFTCPQCDCEFTLRPSDARKRGDRPFCSQQCYSKRSRCSRGHEFTPANTRIKVRNGKERRDCRECERIRYFSRVAGAE